jgi:hypothetical protein
MRPRMSRSVPGANIFPPEGDRLKNENKRLTLNTEPPVSTWDLRSTLDVGRSAFDVFPLTQEGWLSPV